VLCSPAWPDLRMRFALGNACTAYWTASQRTDETYGEYTSNQGNQADHDEDDAGGVSAANEAPADAAKTSDNPSGTTCRAVHKVGKTGLSERFS